MADLTESATWETGVFRLETTTPAQGGPGGPMNAQAQALANRTTFLKQQVEARLPLSGGTMGGPLGLVAPTAAAHAMRRQDVGLERIASTAITGNPTIVEFVLPAGFAMFEFRFSRLGCAADPGAQYLGFQVSPNAGGTWLNNTADYTNLRMGTLETLPASAFDAAAGILSYAATSGLGPNLHGTMTLTPAIPGNSGSHWRADSSNLIPGPGFGAAFVSGLVQSSAVMDRIRFFFNGTQFVSAGSITLMGVRL
jgi:hypothetical protein